MAISAERVTVATTAGGTAVAYADGGADAGEAGQRVNVRNRGSVAVYLGGTGVTTAAGYQLDPGEAVSFYLEDEETLRGITASGTCVVHVLRGGA